MVNIDEYLSPISRRRRTDTMGRFRLFISQSGECKWCKKQCVFEKGPDEFTVDHVIPLGFAGTNHWRNMVGACYECNQKRDKAWRRIKMIWIAPPEEPVEPMRYSLADKLGGLSWQRDWLSGNNGHGIVSCGIMFLEEL